LLALAALLLIKPTERQMGLAIKPTGPEPAVIDEDLCRRCISTVRTKPAAAGEVETKKEATAFREVKCLLLSYQNILKIDNLVGFDKLIKLQLDNNIIEKIENLGHLVNLEALDLSFNNISEISGLDTLTNLTTLSLFSNRITQLGGLDALTKLQVLSVGNNLIQQLDNVMYLRPFAMLQAVNLVGNPFCQDEEYRRYVLAHLKHIKYLDYRLVDQQAVSSAKEQYQDELLELEETEQQEEAKEGEAAEKNKRVALHLTANLKGMDTLFEDMMVKGDGDMSRLRSLQPFQEPLVQLRDQVETLTEEYITQVLEHASLKQKEQAEFQTALDHAKGEADRESKVKIAEYDALAKSSLTGDVDNPTQALQMLHKANDALYEQLMDLEISESERYAESISTFESSSDELMKRTLESLQVYFGQLRELEAVYHERVVAAGSELLERVATDHADNIPEEARALLQDKDTVMGVINAAHDARVSRADAKEDELRQMEVGANARAVKAAVDAEYERNRTRVIEVWNLVHVVHKNELKAARFDD